MNEYAAIGIVEVRYYTTALDIIDIMCKECEVELLSAEKYLGGRLVTVIVGGGVSNVNAAIDCIKLKYENNRSIFKNSVVITRPHKEVMKFVKNTNDIIDVSNFTKNEELELKNIEPIETKESISENIVSNKEEIQIDNKKPSITRNRRAKK